MLVRHDIEKLFPGLGKFLTDGAPGGLQNYINGGARPASTPASSSAASTGDKALGSSASRPDTPASLITAPDAVDRKDRKTLLGGL